MIVKWLLRDPIKVLSFLSVIVFTVHILPAIPFSNLAFRKGVQQDGRLKGLLQQKREIFLLAVLLVASPVFFGKRGEFELDANGASHRKILSLGHFPGTENGTNHLCKTAENEMDIGRHFDKSSFIQGNYYQYETKLTLVLPTSK